MDTSQVLVSLDNLRGFRLGIDRGISIVSLYVVCCLDGRENYFQQFVN